jgi:chromosome segregation ATPase
MDEQRLRSQVSILQRKLEAQARQHEYDTEDRLQEQASLARSHAAELAEKEMRCCELQEELDRSRVELHGTQIEVEELADELDELRENAKHAGKEQLTAKTVALAKMQGEMRASGEAHKEALAEAQAEAVLLRQSLAQAEQQGRAAGKEAKAVVAQLKAASAEVARLKTSLADQEDEHEDLATQVRRFCLCRGGGGGARARCASRCLSCCS